MDLEDLMTLIAILMVWSTLVLLALAFLAGAANDRRRPVPSPLRVEVESMAESDETAQKPDEGAGSA